MGANCLYRIRLIRMMNLGNGVTKEYFPNSCPSFSMDLGEAALLQRIFSEFKISHIPREKNCSEDVLATISHTFHRSLIFVGCSIPLWILRPHLV